jgi:hypothetical protein
MRLAVMLLLLLGCFAAPSIASAKPCEIISPEVSASSAYSGFAESHMCKAGLPALWRGLPDKAISVMRFTFTSGHSMFFRTVTITELADGTGRLEVVGGGFVKHDVRTPWRDIKPVRRKLSAQGLAQLRSLAEQSGAFEHEIGTWDKMEYDRAIFLHCQLLEMEHADVEGYRFSSVNIGCNRPNQLMPLVDAIIAQGRIDMVRKNWAGYP